MHAGQGYIPTTHYVDFLEFVFPMHQVFVDSTTVWSSVLLSILVCPSSLCPTLVFRKRRRGILVNVTQWMSTPEIQKDYHGESKGQNRRRFSFAQKREVIVVAKKRRVKKKQIKQMASDLFLVYSLLLCLLLDLVLGIKITDMVTGMEGRKEMANGQNRRRASHSFCDDDGQPFLQC